jgi:Ca-activated chloride channel homolog
MQTKRAFGYLILTSLLILPLVLAPPAATQVREVLPNQANVSPSPAKQNRLAPSPGTQQDTQDEVVRVDTNLVTIPASVIDRRDGRYLTDLKKEDFHIFEDGVEQDVAFFAPVERPFTILLLLDTSASMDYRLAELNQAANIFLDQLRPDDQLIALEFSDRVRVLCKATSVMTVREGKKLKLHPGGGTLLYDAVDDALKRMQKVSGRKAIVLFSDGYGDGIFTTAKRNLHKAEEQDALIFTVQFDSFLSKEVNPKRIAEVNNYMQDLAQKTGGRHYWVEHIANLEETFGHVADELSRQYSLGYYPKKRLEAGQIRQLKVRVRRPDLDLAVRTRDSYIVDKNLAQGK